MLDTSWGKHDWCGGSCGKTPRSSSARSCHETRKSTSGACIRHGSHLIKAYSRTQSNIALSSWEDEFYALVSTASEALGIVAMSEDFGDKADAYLYADASAAIGVANREGLGRIRHLVTQSLWLQQALSPEETQTWARQDPRYRESIGPDDRARRQYISQRARAEHGLRVYCRTC